MLQTIALWLAAHPWLAPFVIPAATALITAIFHWAENVPYLGGIVTWLKKYGTDGSSVGAWVAGQLQKMFSPPPPPAPPGTVDPNAIKKIGPLAGVIFVLPVIVSGCSWLDSHPAVIPDAEKDAICILTHSMESPAQIALDCAIPAVQTVVDVLDAHKAAAKREAAAAAAHVSDAGADAKGDAK